MRFRIWIQALVALVAMQGCGPANSGAAKPTPTPTTTSTPAPVPAPTSTPAPTPSPTPTATPTPPTKTGGGSSSTPLSFSAATIVLSGSGMLDGVSSLTCSATLSGTDAKVAVVAAVWEVLIPGLPTWYPIPQIESITLVLDPMTGNGELLRLPQLRCKMVSSGPEADAASVTSAASPSFSIKPSLPTGGISCTGDDIQFAYSNVNSELTCTIEPLSADADQTTVTIAAVVGVGSLFPADGNPAEATAGPCPVTVSVDQSTGKVTITEDQSDPNTHLNGGSCPISIELTQGFGDQPAGAYTTVINL